MSHVEELQTQCFKPGKEIVCSISWVVENPGPEVGGCHDQTVKNCGTCNKLAEKRFKLNDLLLFLLPHKACGHASLPVNFKLSQDAAFQISQTPTGKITPQLCGLAWHAGCDVFIYFSALRKKLKLHATHRDGMYFNEISIMACWRQQNSIKRYSDKKFR